MDIMSVAAARALIDGAVDGAAAAAQAANEAASSANSAAESANTAATAANTAKTAANNAATSATNAAAAANAAAGNYSNLDKDAFIDRNAFNLAYTLLQAELRDVQKRLKAAETALANLT